ncbi:MAG TPA: PCYCGC motif-containing (lipo)protein [Longimicrobium sp.]|jgi:hypothetical protein|uniref:PCYCGC motif-containing (lipo)protein n=1 Tax=Longimicrobium sp. TaxID=2029185 RepID=UPI002EDB045B
MPILSSALRGVARTPVLLIALLLCALVPGAARAQDHAHHPHARAAVKEGTHPTPRAGISGARVLPADSVTERGREVYTMAAQIPGLLDGLYCHCDCHARDELRSLLECFENRMASTCGICLGEARKAYEMHKAGKSLAEIRDAIDEAYGG